MSVPYAQIFSELKSDMMSLGGALMLGDEKPKIPAFRKIDAAEAQLDAIEGNLAALPSAGRLAAETNKLSQEQLDAALEAAIPNYRNVKRATGERIGELLAGEIPQDVQDRIQSNAAVKALGGGFAGAGMHRNLVARDLGTTSLNLTDRGLSSAERWMKLSQAPRMNVTSMFFTPSQRLAHEVGERDRQFSRDLVAAEIDAIPSGTNAIIGRWALAQGSKAPAQASPMFGGGMGGGFNFGGQSQAPNFQASGSSASFYPRGSTGVPG